MQALHFTQWLHRASVWFGLTMADTALNSTNALGVFIRAALDLGRSLLLALGLFAMLSAAALAHNVSPEDAMRIAGRTGVQLPLYIHLGAKHMVTGYDHLLFLLGVVFYLLRLRDVAVLVSLFALGHSVTLIVGVLADLRVSPYLVDAVIGLSVVYKGFDNLQGFSALLGERPDERAAVFAFGLFHGLGLATKLRQLGLDDDGLLANLLAFNLGVELGQFAALCVIVMVLRWMPRVRSNKRLATGLNLGLVGAGFALFAYQLGGYFQAGWLPGY